MARDGGSEEGFRVTLWGQCLGVQVVQGTGDPQHLCLPLPRTDSVGLGWGSASVCVLLELQRDLCPLYLVSMTQGASRYLGSG